MKKYTITVNGTPYDVTVEENGSAASAPAAAPTVAAPAAPAAPAPAAAPAQAPAPAASGSVKVESPMPGTILDVKVSAGDTVTNGQVLCILEAMKMENEIVAPQDGKVNSVLVKKNDSVEAGALLVTMD